MKHEPDAPVQETGLFNGIYMKFTAMKLTQANHSNNGNSDFDTNGWIYLIHDSNINPSLDIYNGDYFNPNTSVDTSVGLTEVISFSH